MVPMSYDYLEGFEKIEIDPKKLLTNIKIKNVFYFSHNPKVVSSSLTPATNSYITRTVMVLVIFYILQSVYNNA